MSKPLAPVDLSQPLDLDAAIRIGHAWRELRRGASEKLVREYLHGSGSEALDSGQQDTLDILVQRPEWRMSELADAMRIDPSTATRALQRLIKIKLAERRTDHGDGRVVMVQATEAGRDRQHEIARRRTLLITRLLSAFEPEERVALADLLNRFVSELDAAVADAASVRAATANGNDDAASA